MKKKKTKTDRQKTEAMRKKCVAIAKILSKIRDGYKCRYCGVGKPQGKQVHSHHIFHEGSHKSMSAEIKNLITLCASHHQSFAGNKYAFSFHGCPTESTEWLQENWEYYKEIKILSQKSIHCDIIFWTKKLANLKEELELSAPQQ